MEGTKELITTDAIRSKVYILRGQQVMLDQDLAEIYGYQVKNLNQQVKRNLTRFPEDFMFQLTKEEVELVKSQFVTSRNINYFEGQEGGRRKLPDAFTEQGIYMLATVLRGELAEQQSIFIMRTFREMRHYISQNQQFVTRNATSMHTEDTIKEIGDDMELENNDDKFNIEKTDTIDGLAYEQDTSSLILLLTDGMDWSDMNRHLLLLQDKLNTYIWYIDSGQYKEKYPNVKSVELRVSFLFEEPEICRKLLERAKQVFVDVFENVEMIVEHGTK